MVKIVDMNGFQYEALHGFIDQEGKEVTPLVIVDPNPRGTLEEVQLVKDYHAKLDEMVEIGFLKDISDTRKEGIQEAIDKYGFGFRVFTITEEGRMLFDRKNLVVN